MPLATVNQVELDGALSLPLFGPLGFTIQAQLDAYVQGCINVADAWLQRRAGANYASPDPNVQILLTKGEGYLALHYVSSPLRALKTYGEHEYFISEEAASYDRLVENNWRQMAMALLDEFLTVEDAAGKGFAMPVLSITAPVSVQATETSLDWLEDLLSYARNMQEVPFATVTR